VGPAGGWALELPAVAARAVQASALMLWSQQEVDFEPVLLLKYRSNVGPNEARAPCQKDALHAVNRNGLVEC
jgi:hypothetical protein